jgi:hypothetical protein
LSSPRFTITETTRTVTVTKRTLTFTIVDNVGPFASLPQAKFAMTPWGVGSVAENRVVSIETGSLSTYPQGRAGFNTQYVPFMGEGQGDLTGTQPPVNPQWCAFPALYDADPSQDVPITPAEATSRGLPQSVVRPTQSLQTVRPKMRGWVEIDVVGAQTWVDKMAAEYALWVEKFVEPISADNDATQYKGMVLINWERLKAFTFDYNFLNGSGDASWRCYRQWRQLQTGGTGTLASPFNTVTGGTETEQQSRERLRELVADFMGAVVAMMRTYLPLAHIAWWNEPSPQNWYQLDATDTTVWNGSPVAIIDGTAMTRAEAIRYETLGWMRTDLCSLFDSIHAQVYDFLPPASETGSTALYGDSPEWVGDRPANDVEVAHFQTAEKTRLSRLYIDLMEDLRALTGKPIVGWFASVNYFSQTTGYRCLRPDLELYLNLVKEHAPNWSVGFWIDCLNYEWENATLGTLDSAARFNEVLQGLEILNPLIAEATGDAGNGTMTVDFPAPTVAGLPEIVGPTYSGLTASES